MGKAMNFHPAQIIVDSYDDNMSLMEYESLTDGLVQSAGRQKCLPASMLSAPLH
jgi:hypothetical protein